MDQGLFAPPHDFSQLITSFIACKSLGIHRTPFLTCLHAPHCCGRCLLKVVRFSKFNEFMRLISLMLMPLVNSLEDYLYCLKFARILSRFLSKESCVVQYVKDRLQLNCCDQVENNGFEPLTPCLQSRCSSQLS